eukprot:jgi/Chlat1/5203/Chrsp33S05044
MASQTSLNLRQRQYDAIVRMLNLNATITSSGAGEQEEVYKVLVLDKYCRDVISPLLKVNDLRKHGITLHLLIDAERQPIADVPAIYFVQPTEQNVRKILADASRGLYDSMHLNFSSSLPRPLLEQLATGAVKADCLHRVAKVYDQYVGFVALEPRMFTLAQPRSYAQLHDPTASDTDVEAAVQEIVSGIFGALATLGAVPIIRCQKGGAAEMVAAQLDARLRDHLNSRHNLFADAPLAASTFQRPLLCLFDRTFDLSVILQHAWSYQPLVHDILALKLNRVTVAAEGSTGGPSITAGKRSYDLDESDAFWVTNANSPFPKVAEEVELQLTKYKLDVEEVNKKTAGKADELLDGEGTALLGNTKHLVSVVNSLPELTERKRIIDKHTNIATALLGHIKSRAIDAFCSLEDELFTKGAADMSGLLAAIHPSAKGTPEDKLRLAVVYILCTAEPPSSTDLASIESTLQESGAPLLALRYVRQIRAISQSIVTGSTAPSSVTNIAGLTSRSQLLDWADKLYGSSISAVTAGVKNLLSGVRQLAAVRVMEALMEGKQTPETDAYLYFDPKGPRTAPSAAPVQKGPFKEAIAFVIGGGNYKEYLGLQEFASKHTPPKSVAYGSTEVLTGTEFLEQLTELGQKTST